MHFYGIGEILKLYPKLKVEIYEDNISSIKLFKKFPIIEVKYL